jgi:hypothetical protein
MTMPGQDELALSLLREMASTDGVTPDVVSYAQAQSEHIIIL